MTKIIQMIMEIQRQNSNGKNLHYPSWLDGVEDFSGDIEDGLSSAWMQLYQKSKHVSLEEVDYPPDLFKDRKVKVITDRLKFRMPAQGNAEKDLIFGTEFGLGFAVETRLAHRGNTTSNLSSARRLYIQTHRITDEGTKRYLLEKGVKSPAGKPHFMVSCCFAPAGLDLSDVKDMRAWAAEGRCDTLFSPAAKSGVLLSDVVY